MINFFFFFLVINVYSMVLGVKNALSLLMMLEIFILSYLFFFLFLFSKTSLILFSVSFLLMSIAVLAATLGLCLLSSFSKTNTTDIKISFF